MFDTVSAADIDPDPDMVVGATSEELFELVRGIHEQRRALDLAEAVVLAEIDRRDVTDRELGLRTPSWLARETGVPPAVAKKRVKVATMLRRWFPELVTALADGRLTWEHVRLVCDVANPWIVEPFADLQESLIELADGIGFDGWARQVRGLAELLDQDGGHDPNRDLERNQLSYTRTTDGITHLRGMLLGELGLTFDQILTAATDALSLQYARDHERCPEIEIPARTTLQALALSDLLRQALGVDLASSNPPVAEVVLRVQADDLATKTDLHGVRLQDGSTRTLLCDADLYAIVVNSLGEPLDQGRRLRYANDYQRRTLRERDGGCIFPGCDCPPRWCDVHHQVPWDKGGRTDVKTMALLCRHHHRVTHRPGWRLDVTADQWFSWTTPEGRTFWSQRHGRQRAGPAPPAGSAPTACCN